MHSFAEHQRVKLCKDAQNLQDKKWGQAKTFLWTLCVIIDIYALGKWFGKIVVKKKKETQNEGRRERRKDGKTCANRVKEI